MMPEFKAHCTVGSVDGDDAVVIGRDDDGWLVIDATEGESNAIICLSMQDADRLADYLNDAGFGRNAV